MTLLASRGWRKRFLFPSRVILRPVATSLADLSSACVSECLSVSGESECLSVAFMSNLFIFFFHRDQINVGESVYVILSEHVQRRKEKFGLFLVFGS